MSEKKKYEILSRETLFQGYFRVERFHFRHQKFDGTWSATVNREVYQYGRNVSGVLLFDPQQDKLVLVEQFRTGPTLHGEYPWLIELVAGMVDGGETPEQAARREAVEEAGCEIIDLQPITNYYTSPGGTSDFINLYIGRVEAPEDGMLAGVSNEQEDIRVHVIDSMTVLRMLFSNKIRDAQTIIALQWFAMHRTELRRRWLVSDVGTPII